MHSITLVLGASKSIYLVYLDADDDDDDDGFILSLEENTIA
jgi:hypothetical protein